MSTKDHKYSVLEDDLEETKRNLFDVSQEILAGKEKEQKLQLQLNNATQKVEVFSNDIECLRHKFTETSDELLKTKSHLQTVNDQAIILKLRNSTLEENATNCVAQKDFEDLQSQFRKQGVLLEKANELVASMREEVAESNTQLRASEDSNTALNRKLKNQGDLVCSLQNRLNDAHESEDKVAGLEERLHHTLSELEEARADLLTKEKECAHLQEHLKKQSNLKSSSQVSNLRLLIEEQQHLLIQRDASLNESQLQVERLLQENERLQFKTIKKTTYESKKENNENVVNGACL